VLLRTVVEVALDPPAALVGSCDDAGARCGELGVDRPQVVERRGQRRVEP
jgi:hypothetical protein